MRPRGVRRRELLAGVASLAVALPGCAGVGVETTYRRPVEESYGVAVNSLAVEMPRGDVTVRGTDEREVRLSGTVVGERQTAVEATDVAGDHSGGHLTLCTRRNGRAVDDVGVDLTVRAARDVRVSEVRLGSGSVSMSDVAGPLRTETGRGTVSLAGVAGSTTVAAERGEVSVTDVDGAVTVSLSEGEVSVADVNGDVSVTGVDGDVSVTGVDGDVRAAAGTGFVGVSDVTGDVTATVESGDIDVVGVDGEVRTS